MTNLTENQRQEVRDIVEQEVEKLGQRLELERHERLTTEVAWRTKLDSTLEHLVEAVDSITASVSGATNGALPRVRQLEEDVRGVQGAMTRYGWFLGAIALAAATALTKMVVEFFARGGFSILG